MANAATVNHWQTKPDGARMSELYIFVDTDNAGVGTQYPGAAGLSGAVGVRALILPRLRYKKSDNLNPTNWRILISGTNESGAVDGGVVWERHMAAAALTNAAADLQADEFQSSASEYNSLLAPYPIVIPASFAITVQQSGGATASHIRFSCPMIEAPNMDVLRTWLL